LLGDADVFADSPKSQDQALPHREYILIHENINARYRPPNPERNQKSLFRHIDDTSFFAS
jgi:hypothetical protein